MKIAKEAEEAARAAPDAGDGAAGAAWVVRALVERDRTADADATLGRAVALAGNVANPNRRVEVLFLLVQAGWPPGSRSWEAAVSALAGAGRVAASAKASSVLWDLVLMLAADGRDHSAVLAAIPEGKCSRQVVRRLESPGVHVAATVLLVTPQERRSPEPRTPASPKPPLISRRREIERAAPAPRLGRP